MSEYTRGEILIAHVIGHLPAFFFFNALFVITILFLSLINIYDTVTIYYTLVLPSILATVASVAFHVVRD